MIPVRHLRCDPGSGGALKRFLRHHDGQKVKKEKKKPSAASTLSCGPAVRCCLLVKWKMSRVARLSGLSLGAALNSYNLFS